MTKLIDILHNLLTAPKDAVEFELLAEQKIGEIEDMLNEIKPPSIYLKTYGKDNLDAAKKLAQDWIANWKENNEGEPISTYLSNDNNKLYNYIREYYIETKQTTWSELGFKEYGNKYYLKYRDEPDDKKLDIVKELAQNWITDWKENHEDEEPTLPNLRNDKNNQELYTYINTHFILTKKTTWQELGFKESGNKYTLKYGIDNLDAAKKLAQDWIADWKKAHEDKEPTSINLRNDKDNKDLHYYIKEYYIRTKKTTWEKLGFDNRFNKYLSIYGKDLEAAKKLTQDWIADWYKTNEDEPISFDLKYSDKELYYYISDHFIKNKLITWPELGFAYTPLTKRMIYAYEFRDIKEKDEYGNDILVNYVYVGLTNNPNRRKKEHLNITKLKDQIKTDIKKAEASQKQTTLTAIAKFLIDHPEINSSQIEQVKKLDFVEADIASAMEGRILDNYIKKGWIPLNKQKAGNLGGVYKRKRKVTEPSSEEKK